MSNPTKATWRTEILPLILIGFGLICSFYFYAHFPQQVPTHWNFRGEIDGWSGKAFAAFFFPALNLGIYLLFLGMPYLDPKKDRYAEFARPYHIFKNFMVGFLTVVYFYVGLAGLGYNYPVNYVIPPGIGILFLAMGNYLGKIKPNWFMGIRTPWTLSNEEVWNKTHRLGGKMFIVMGILMIAGVVLPPGLFYSGFMFGVVIAALVPIVYSYWLFRQLEKNQ